MRREMEREFEEQFKDIENRAPKDLVREYETAGGGKVREYGPVVYGYSIIYCVITKENLFMMVSFALFLE
jgi:hypothetical protein